MSEDSKRNPVEPWLRGTRSDTPAVARAVLHALDLAQEDFSRWVWPLAADEATLLEEGPLGLPSVGYQARHIARSLDRLLCYAEGGALNEQQLVALRSEHDGESAPATREEFERALVSAEQRIVSLAMLDPDAARYVGRDRLPVTLGGLLVHLADHTQRHAGQAVTTAKVLIALRDAAQS